MSTITYPKLGKKDVWSMLAIFLVTFVAYGAFLYALPITDTVESNYALSAKEMFLAKDWLSPRIFGEFWYDKPPFEYWAIMVSYSLFGISDVAARIPSIVVAALGVTGMYGATQVLVNDRRISTWASIILATSLGYWYITHAVLTDGWLFFFSLGIYFFSYRAFSEGNKNAMRYAYIAAALAVLTKGPVGIVLPGMVLIAYALSARAKTIWKILFDPIGIFLFAVVVLPWYVGMYWVHGMDFITGFLGLHNVVRATQSEHPRFDHWYYYLIIWPLSLLPWTGYTVSAIVIQRRSFWNAYKEQRLKNLLASNRWIVNRKMIGSPSWYYFSALWTVIVLVFYTLVATKYLTYIFIAYIPAVMWGAQKLVAMEEERMSMRSYWHKLAWKKFLIVGLGPTIMLLALVGAVFTLHLNGEWIFYIVFTIGLAIMAIMYGKKHKLAIACFVAWYGVILTLLPLQITSVLDTTSAKSLVPYTVNTQEKHIFFYRFYPVSYSFYAEKVGTVLLADDQATDVWVKGKSIMPHETTSHYRSEPGDIIFVLKKYEEDLKKKVPYISFDVVDEHNDWLILKVK